MPKPQLILEPEALAYLRLCKPLSDLDPDFVIQWDYMALAAIVDGVNGHNHHDVLPPVSEFIHLVQGQISLESLKNDIMTAMEEFAGGRYSDFLLAPNDIVQAGQIRDALRDLQYSPYMQTISELFLPETHFFACVWYVTNARGNCRRANINPPPGDMLRLFE